MPKRSIQSSLVLCIALGIGVLAAACGDDAKKDDCADGGTCAGSGGAPGGGSGNGAAGDNATGGTNGGSGTSGSAGDGASGSGAGASGGAGSGAAGTGATAPDKPKSDGTELSTCDPRADMACMGDLVCYNAENATPVGFCTKTCTTDDDCKSLGDTYTCSSPSGASGTGSCRVSCTGTDDTTSCSKDFSCQQVQGGFRCLYDEKDIGTGTGKAWDECTISGDCSGDLVCYPDRATAFGGSTYSGACTTKCMKAEDCKDMPSSGNIMPSCGGGGNCVLDCTVPGGPGGGMQDGGAPECPDGMTCANLGGGRHRCMYVDTSGGV